VPKTVDDRLPRKFTDGIECLLQSLEVLGIGEALRLAHEGHFVVEVVVDDALRDADLGSNLCRGRIEARSREAPHCGLQDRKDSWFGPIDRRSFELSLAIARGTHWLGTPD